MRTKFLILTAVAASIILTGAGCIQFGLTAATGPMGIFRTSDGGTSWVKTSNLLTATGIQSLSGIKVYRMYDDPSDHNAWYLTTRGQGVFYTYDNGDSWLAIPFLKGQFIYGFAVDPKNKCLMYASDGPHIYKTVDCARTWELVYTEELPSQRFVSLAIDYGDTDVVYGAKLGGAIVVSTDKGHSWSTIKSFGFEVQQLTADPRQSGRLYLAGYRAGLYRSEDGGITWTNLTSGLSSFNESTVFYRLILNPGQRDSLFWISKYGILRSDNAGLNWSEIKLLTPPGSVNIYGFAINPKNQNEMYYTGTVLGDNNTHVRSTFYKSVDGGHNWVTKKLPTNTIPNGLWMNLDNPNVMMMGFTTLQ